MFICGEVGDVVAMVRCTACGWTGFAGEPEPDDPEEEDHDEPYPMLFLLGKERVALMYQSGHTGLACRTWKRDHDPDPRERLPGKRGRAFGLYRKGHAKHPAVPLRRRGDGEMACPTCGFVP
jgi:hypothetical protein